MSGPADDGMDGLSACECPVCFNFLSESLPPMSMPCGHTLCSVCVHQLVAKATTTGGGAPTFRCPLCREWVNRDSVTLNHTLRDLIAQLASIGVRPGSPQSRQARVLSALHVDFSEIEMGPSLDRGAFGEVFRGYWKGNDIAVKMFSSGILTPEAMQAFQREVFVMNCLRHPNVVLLMGACQTPPRLAILMEFVAGGSLHKLLHVDKTSLSLDQVCSLGSDICRGLQYLHSINILHRDLKSKNVLLSGPPPSGQAKLCDFGLARMRLESATLTGNVGTVHWSAPEVLANSRYKFPADMYSLGMVLYEMSCGCVPFSSMMPVAVMMAVAVKREKPAIPSSVDKRMTQLISDCIAWEPSERPPVAEVLSSLHTITPPHSITPTQERRAQLSHSDSLGIVFVSVTDTATLHNQGEDLVDVARNMGILQQDQHNINRYPSEEDRLLAREIELAERDAMVSRDEELAHQMQLRENAYLTPSDTKTKVFPPKSVLDLIKKSSNKRPPPPAVELAPDPVKTTRTKLAIPSTKTTPTTKSMKHAIPLTEAVPLSKKTPTTDLSSSSKKTKKFSFGKKKSAKDNSDEPSPLKSKLKSKTMKLPLQSKKPPSPHIPPPPPPPPPPPLPPSLTPRPTPFTKSTRPLNKARYSKREMLREIRSHGEVVARSLRPVETVEKKAFRVGHVVDGYSSERAQFTVQNLIRSFNPSLLRHVEVVEPTPPFPVGHVVHPTRGQNVKRLSSLIELKRDPPPVSFSKRGTLSPAIKEEIAMFKAQWLKQVIPHISNTLPTMEDILNQRAIDRADDVNTGQSDASNSATQSALLALNPNLKLKIVSFNKKLLHRVTTVIKQWTPTTEDIAMEKKLSQSGEPADSAHPDEEPKTKTNEQLDGFW